VDRASRHPDTWLPRAAPGRWIADLCGVCRTVRGHRLERWVFAGAPRLIARCEVCCTPDLKPERLDHAVASDRAELSDLLASGACPAIQRLADRIALEEDLGLGIFPSGCRVSRASLIRESLQLGSMLSSLPEPVLTGNRWSSRARLPAVLGGLTIAASPVLATGHHTEPMLGLPFEWFAMLGAAAFCGVCIAAEGLAAERRRRSLVRTFIIPRVRASLLPLEASRREVLDQAAEMDEQGIDIGWLDVRAVAVVGYGRSAIVRRAA
jgi:hypothetical protein